MQERKKIVPKKINRWRHFCFLGVGIFATLPPLLWHAPV